MGHATRSWTAAVIVPASGPPLWLRANEIPRSIHPLCQLLYAG